ncbi:protein-ADP-ribose hydrolase [Mitsuokella sp. AF21-1AC]|uniref:protein-ADP-ribose hydrolase n=1 Tax=Mitsuokella sp. AF21-1AC TaxID=2292235 RepID=UPI000E5533CE|nr:protein-ADP-ribose hydrolase [Mitsuokella sp. AF21-1AC]RGS72537.1 protein-ADP-ribose hydrolase [Mitsuokella sp. AF21-1AC]
MIQEERRIWLIRYLQREMPEYAHYRIPDDEAGQWHLLRALFNVRPPAPVPREFKEIEGALLERMTKEKGIVDAMELPLSAIDPRLALWRGDITRLRIDAIVNAANSQMLGCFQPNHNCIDNIEQTMAGVEMRYDCYKLMQAQGHEESTGKAKITSGHHLPARFVLHTVGPIVQGRLTNEHRRLLVSCYESCLALAPKHGLKSVAFCCISTGVFHFPKEEAAKIAVHTVQKWLDERLHTSIKRVVFDVFEQRDYLLYASLLGEQA